LIDSGERSKPDCRAGQQRVHKQQVQIAIHAVKLVLPAAAVNGICFQRMGSQPVCHLSAPDSAGLI
jgi:hypothetical protein